MINYIIKASFAIAILLTTYISKAQDYQLVWSDEFETQIGPDWVFDIGRGVDGWGNHELQYYRQENASIENGQLVITAKKENYGGANYTSAKLKTQGKASWKYGKIEARIKLPSFMGSWPAFWMLSDKIGTISWPYSGEIDIMEHVNVEDKTHGTIHWADENNHKAEYGGSTTIDVTQYHTYGVEWDETAIRWYVDGNQFFTADIANNVNSTHEFHEKFFAILNMAIGGTWPGYVINDNALPAKMYVDYVRVYQKTENLSITNKSGTFYLKNRHSGKYLAVENNGTSSGDRLVQSNHITNQTQKFVFSHIGDGVYQINNKNSALALSVENQSSANGASVIQANYNNANHQKFALQITNDGFYKLKNINSQKIVEVNNFGTNDGDYIQLWEDDNQYSGQWILESTGDLFIEAENFTYTDGGFTVENTTDIGGGKHVNNINTGSWMAYENAVTIIQSGNYKIEYRISSNTGGGTISSDLNGGDIVLGTVNVPNTNGNQNWTTISHEVALTAGTYNFGIFASQGGWNINWIRITAIEDITTSLQTTTYMKNVCLLPNPASNYIQITDADKLLNGNLTIYNTSGNKESEQKFTENTINIENLKPGMYFLIIENGQNRVSEKFIKE